MKIGYAFVVGDLFHIGHLNLLKKAKEHCDFLIVGVLTDEAVEAYKRKPIIPLEERIAIIKELRCVDKVVAQNERDPTKTMERLTKEGWKPSFLFHGTDWSEVPGTEYIESVGGKLIQPPYYYPRTTTNIIKKIRSLER